MSLVADNHLADVERSRVPFADVLASANSAIPTPSVQVREHDITRSWRGRIGRTADPSSFASQPCAVESLPAVVAMVWARSWTCEISNAGPRSRSSACWWS